VSISPDGEWLLYDSNRTGNQDIYKARLSGGDPIRLTNDPADDFDPVMSPNGEEIAFYSLRRGGVRRAFTMLATGEHEEEVLPDSVGEPQYLLNWRPDGNALSLQVTKNGVHHVDLVFRQQGRRWGGLRHMTSFGGASWSPDGKWLVVGNDDGISLATPDGHHPHVLVPRSQLSAFFWGTWGSNSETLFFRTQSASGQSLFWSVPTAGGKPRLLLRIGDPSHVSRTALFATDGKQLYFTLSSDEQAIWRLELVQ
jgi:Tol biopolymer transport system component